MIWNVIYTNRPSKHKPIASDDCNNPLKCALPWITKEELKYDIYKWNIFKSTNNCKRVIKFLSEIYVSLHIGESKGTKA